MEFRTHDAMSMLQPFGVHSSVLLPVAYMTAFTTNKVSMGNRSSARRKVYAAETMNFPGKKAVGLRPLRCGPCTPWAL